MNYLKIGFIILFSNISFAQSFNMNQGSIKNDEYYTEVNFEFINGKIIIPVIIDNKAHRFLLDTGAPNIISKNLNNTLNPKLLEEAKVTDANDNKSLMNVIELSNLTIGSILFENSVALASNDEKNLAFDCFNIDGFIGSNLLRNSIIQINTKSKILTITNNIKKLNINKKNSSKISLVGKQSSPYLWIKLKGKKTGKEQVLLDTGMKGFYDVSNRNFSIFKKIDIFKIIDSGNGTQGIGLFGNAQNSAQTKVLLPEMQITNSTFINITSITTNDNNSRLGSELFENGIATIDYMNKKFYFDEYNASTDLSEKERAFSTTILNDKYIIGIVWQDKLKDKLYFGDEILELNGINYANYPLCDLIAKESIFKNFDIKEIKVRNKSGEIIIINL